jgi:predicted metalloprotease with PDZ domain
MAAGRLGVRRELIAGVRVVVAGPLNEGVRRLDMLALLNWNLPRAKRLFPDMPKRIIIVSAGDPMFRGGLSGPNSLFIHADRPLLSENGSSTLIHELVHVANRLEGEKGADWIVEGIAEYYSLKLMWRSGTLDDHRYKQTFRKYEMWAEEADRLDVEIARGPITARAVGIMRKLDHEIHKKTKRQESLDDVVRLLADAQQKVSLDDLRKAVVEVMGEPANALSDEQLRLGADND